MTDDRDSLLGRTLDGRYRIESLIARGGMATVYVASDLRLRRNVAVKVMHSSLAEDPEFVHRFEREAHAAAQLTNPHVVAVHDQGRDAATGVVYLVMEYVVGRTVREIMATRGALTEVQALAVLDPVLQALAAAHDAGFVHRDVKPENVLIGDDGRIKVTDFGLARAIVASPMSAATQGVLIGTVAYLSPEQVNRGFADARSDVYGAGVLLYELLTGQVPHTGETPLAVAYQHVHNDVPAPSAAKPGISAALDTLVERATRRDPTERFQNAREFLAAVRAARAGIDQSYVPSPMPAQHTAILPTAQDTAAIPLPEPTSTRPRRRKLGLVVALVASVLALAGGWYVTFGTHSPVPDVVGLQQSVAEQQIAGVSLTVAVEQAWSKTVPEGAVISSDPQPNTDLEHGSLVTLLVSKGPERYAVPDLIGNGLEAVKVALGEVKLSIGRTTYVYDETVPKGKVISTQPTAGIIMQPRETVDLTISKGPAPIPVPNVSGLALDAARQTVESAGFTVRAESAYSDTVREGVVVRTEPAAGTQIQRTSMVTIITSKGPAPVTVPDVFKMSRSKAEATLKALGLKVVVKTSGKRLLNIVQDQTPKAGSVIPRGSTVTLTVV